MPEKNIDLDRIANLARIALSEEEKQNLRKRLEEMLVFFETIEKVDVSQVEPMAHAFATYNVWEPDEPTLPFTPEQALANAPATKDHQILVPKVIE